MCRRQVAKILFADSIQKVLDDNQNGPRHLILLSLLGQRGYKFEYNATYFFVVVLLSIIAYNTRFYLLYFTPLTFYHADWKICYLNSNCSMRKCSKNMCLFTRTCNHERLI